MNLESLAKTYGVPVEVMQGIIDEANKREDRSIDGFLSIVVPALMDYKRSSTDPKTLKDYK